ncbi:hypothetical protein O6H91_19G032300 [Diphasiastrum complanatum]|uniref:Uncharacterized protein n=1 Tax=Diphasiastrum complanatum TaxID=34168 RepID=A0ACC2ATS2_DIPCM|nr:hypothetical protein O6H91_19G032300 [Diphasiastrum complanatum]
MENSIAGYMSHILMDDELGEEESVIIPCHSIQAVEHELENLLTDTSANEFSHHGAGYGSGEASQRWEINSKNWADNLLRELELEDDGPTNNLNDSYASGSLCFSAPSSNIAYLDHFIDEERKSLERWYDRDLPISPCNSSTDRQLHFQGLSLSSPVGKYGTGQVAIWDLASPPATELDHAHYINSGLRSQYIHMAYPQQSYCIDRSMLSRTVPH